MVRLKRLLAVVVALSVPLVGIGAIAGPAGAHKSLASGTITCAYSQTISFNPPLSGGAGTAGYSKDVISIAPAHVSGCTGTVSPSYALPTIGAWAKAAVLKWKGVKIGGVWKAGSCPMLSNFLWPKLKPHFLWTAAGGLRLKPSKLTNVTVTDSSSNVSHTLGFLFTGTSTGSFAGPVTIGAYLTSASNTALANCIANSGTVGSVTIDPTVSTVTAG